MSWGTGGVNTVLFHSLNPVVHNRLILIAEKDTVYEKFPTPLINRLEKHFVLTSSILEDWQEETLEEFETWISNFSNARWVYYCAILYFFYVSFSFFL